MVNWLLVVGRLLIVEDQYSVYQSTGSSYTLDSWRPALGSTGAHIPRSIINHAAANAPKKLSLLDGAVTFVCNCVLARIWELLVLREALLKKKCFLLGIARKGGGGDPCPNFLTLFFHHVVPYILTSISCSFYYICVHGVVKWVQSYCQHLAFSQSPGVRTHLLIYLVFFFLKIKSGRNWRITDDVIFQPSTCIKSSNGAGSILMHSVMWAFL